MKIRIYIRLVTFVLATLAILVALSDRTIAQYQSIDDLLDNSKAVFIGTVMDIDERWVQKIDDFDANKNCGALTKIVFTIDEVLAGSTESQEIEMTVRGGIRLDELIENWSNVPEFSKGDQYIIFLRDVSSYSVHPVVHDRNRIMRFSELEGKEVLVDEGGHGVVLGENGTLESTKKISDGMSERRGKQRFEEKLSQSLVNKNPIEANTVEIEKASNADEIISSLKVKIRKSEKKGKWGSVKNMDPRPIGKDKQTATNE